MSRGVHGEPSRRLLELALAADPVAATGLVPGHRDVNQALEEVALDRRGRPPGDLELLVRGEVLAALDQLQAALQRGGTRFPASALLRLDQVTQTTTLTSPSSTTTSYIAIVMARSNSFSPVVTSNCQPCQGQVRTQPSSRPWPSGPPRCGQVGCAA